MIIVTNNSHKKAQTIDKPIFVPLEKNEVFHNTKLKIYNDFVKVSICNKAIFKTDGFEEINPKEKVPKPKNMSNEVRNDSVKRAKEKAFDIAYLNDFTHFITWTLDKNKIDRFDSKLISTKLKIFLNNMQKRHNLKYLVIPERHKDGALHIHGLISGDLKFIDSNTRLIEGYKKPVHKSKDKENNGKVVYNMPQWSLGFSTAIELTGDRTHIAKYILKYISKDFQKIFGKFYYAGGKGLQRKPLTKLYDIPYSDVKQKEYTVPDVNLGFKYLSIDKKIDETANPDYDSEVITSILSFL